ncbi:patatin-like phospholipase family protein [Marinobacter koreensis]|uniref:Patatin-like phospholipase family protein n=1 Tax=Marinobacter koreensis TaxID=335974 RepID=A0ABW0RIA9_9GAMM|nr:patatin-like phospholipase family protein [Marinobacter koreensis]MCK7548548.1 patatin-like phospholipase family protein [Marinobacter koreensis]MDX1819235.1 patatin-like phospholipase family protein [Marinobacter sp.]
MARDKEEQEPRNEKVSSSDQDSNLSKVMQTSDVSAVASSQDEGKRPARRRTVALTLGSGGARGYAHIGAIEMLVERGYEIVAISGCSMGALIGGMFAAGKMQAYKDWVTGLGQFDVLKLLDVTFNSVGAIRGEKIFAVVRDMLGDTRIEDLPLAYTSVATDLLAHKEVWFQEGPLDQAIRASVAIPSVVTPLVLNGRVLVDGALLNPLPIIPTISAHADMIVAVNLSGEDDQRRRIPDAAFVEEDENADMEEWVHTIREKASRWFDWDTVKSLASRRAQHEDSPETKLSREVRKKEDKKHSAHPGGDKGHAEEHETIDWDKLGIGKFDVMNLTIETMQSALVQYKIAGYPPDLLVNVPKNACRSYDYHKAPELIQLGRERMAAALDRYELNRNSSGPLAV